MKMQSSRMPNACPRRTRRPRRVSIGSAARMCPISVRSPSNGYIRPSGTVYTVTAFMYYCFTALVIFGHLNWIS